MISIAGWHLYWNGECTCLLSRVVCESCRLVESIIPPRQQCVHVWAVNKLYFLRLSPLSLPLPLSPPLPLFLPFLSSSLPLFPPLLLSPPLPLFLPLLLSPPLPLFPPLLLSPPLPLFLPLLLFASSIPTGYSDLLPQCASTLSR